jgi:hypothetical protein
MARVSVLSFNGTLYEGEKMLDAWVGCFCALANPKSCTDLHSCAVVHESQITSLYQMALSAEEEITCISNPNL